MTRQELLSLLFPQPTATFDSEGSEVNGLPRDTVPQNCEVLDSGLGGSELLRRQDHFLVRVAGVLVFLRICTADAQSDYGEYAVIRRVALTPQDQAELLAYAREAIDALCSSRN